MPNLPRLANMFKLSLDVLLTPAEDPREHTVEVGDPLQRMLGQLRRAAESNRALQQNLAEHMTQLQTRLADFEAEARRALAESGEAVARAVLQRRHTLALELENVRAHRQSLQHEAQRLSLLEQRVLAQLDLLAARQSLSTTRLTTAEAQAQLGEMLAGLSAEFEALQRATEQADAQTEHLHARAAAIEDLLSAGALSPSADAHIEAQLVTLRRQETKSL